jgi:hypothetical protein
VRGECVVRIAAKGMETQGGLRMSTTVTCGPPRWARVLLLARL